MNQCEISLPSCLAPQAYVVPRYFCDDWLNEYHDMRRAIAEAGSPLSPSDGAAIPPQEEPFSRLAASDYRFVYLGPKARLRVCGPPNVSKLFGAASGLTEGNLEVGGLLDASAMRDLLLH